MTKRLRKCIFCGFEGNLTNEHILSRWLHRYVPPSIKNYRTLRATSYHDRSDFQTGKRAGDPRGWKIRCVCEATCNNGWMRRLDEETRPIMVPIVTGEEIRITPSQQTTIAAWAAMKAMVAEFEDPGHITTHHAQRKRMMKRQLPPDNTWGIWIGHYPRKIWTPYWVTHPFLVLSSESLKKRRDERATYFNGQASTQVVGELFIHIIRLPMPSLIRNWQFGALPDSDTLPDGGTLTRIWPAATYSIIWPSRSLSERDARAAAGAFRSFLERPTPASADSSPL